MRILLTGATGFIGSRLCQTLNTLAYEIIALSRQPEQAKALLPQSTKIIQNLQQIDFNQIAAVINLAGAPIFEGAWKASRKAELINSRVALTQQLSAYINRCQTPPHCFISASATGYYAPQQQYCIDENSPAGTDFIASLCQQWENSALQAQTRVCLLRTGLVFGLNGGMLAKILPLYRWGLGGKLGTGKQYWSWIDLQDAVNGILFLLHQPQAQGAFNFVAPEAITNQVFSQELSQILQRPDFASVPAFVLKILFGERASLLLNSHNVLPQKLLAQGFVFQQPNLQQCLQHLLCQK